MKFVILSGGSGSRLWPKSREKLPKQFLKMTNEYTMLQNTVLRVQKLSNKNSNIEDKIIVICNKDHAHIVELQLHELNVLLPIQVISEPKGRDSAPAICIASLLGNIDDNTMIMPCDHIFDDNIFVNCYLESLPYLEKSIVTFGIRPTHIETGYGYIKTDAESNTIQFVEKPNFETAKTYFEEGCYLWNAGIFVFKNKNMVECFRKYAPDILDCCENTLSTSSLDSPSILLNDQTFSMCISISVDYAIMEPLCNDNEIQILKKTFLYDGHWNDIGSFSAVYNELNKIQITDNNNIVKGDILTFDTSNCYIESERGIVSTIGVNNLIIINSDDAVLICNKDQSQDVKKIVEKLKKENREEAYFHKTVFRPWGWYKNVEGSDTNGFKVKRIAVYPGKRLSLQSHNYRSEHWVMVRGNSMVTLGTDEIILQKDQHIYIPVKTLHRIENIGEDLLEFTETQIGDYLGEDDIIRYEDDFGRV